MNILPFLSLLLISLQLPPHALSLSTSSRWIVDGSGRRVKLACLSWASHLDPMVTEGLSKQPLDYISKQIVSMGFNCVRLTWALFMVTNETLGSLTVRQSFQRLGLNDSLAGIQAYNPLLVDLPIIQVLQVVVSSLGEHNITVILDNHVSKPEWCCSNSDGNGFFGDTYFDPEVWLAGLARVAAMFRNSSNVIGMSLRNELRGPKQNVGDWYRYMQQGAETVHASNPDALVIISGLIFDRDLSFLNQKMINVSFAGKLVFELHWYAFSDGKAWTNGNMNNVCGASIRNLKRIGGFLLDKGWPLFLSEFGVDQRGGNVNDNRYLSCLLGVAADLDLDWALWTLQGSYYLREGVLDMEETYGALSKDWSGPRNASFLQIISTIQPVFQGPGVGGARHEIIFHPLTSQCILRKSIMDPLFLGPCSESEAWSYTPQRTLTLKATYFCLQATSTGNPAKLGITCTNSGSQWNPSSDSNMHLSTKLANGMTVCLDVGPNNILVTNPCKCMNGGGSCDPSSQWFKIVKSERGSHSGNSSPL